MVSRDTWKRTARLLAAAMLLGALYALIPWRDVVKVLAQLDGRWMAAALVLFVPQTMVAAWRWHLLVAPWQAISLVEAARHTLVASAWNLVVPSKLGDLGKATMVEGVSLAERTALGGRAVGEKLGDLAALAVWMLAGWWGWPGLGGLALATLAAMIVVDRRHARRGSTAWRGVLLATVALWAMHLAQIGLFMAAAGVRADVPTIVARVPLALFAGLLPLSFCGVGTRDSALVYLFADLAPAAAMAVVGLLTTLRYLVPGAAGVAWLATSGVSRRSAVSVACMASSGKR